MSLVRLLLAGFLIAGGLILGAFTLHGYLDPDWAQRRMMAAGAKPSEPGAVDTFSARNSFVAGKGEQASPAANPAPKAAAKPSPPSPSPVQADAKAPPKPAAKKKVAEKTDKAEKQDKAKPPQQASVGFPWNLFKN